MLYMVENLLLTLIDLRLAEIEKAITENPVFTIDQDTALSLELSEILEKTQTIWAEGLCSTADTAPIKRAVERLLISRRVFTAYGRTYVLYKLD